MDALHDPFLKALLSKSLMGAGEMAEPSPRMSSMKIKDAARLLGIPIATIYYMVQRGVMPGFKVGGQWRVLDATVDEFQAKLSARQSTMSIKSAAKVLKVALPTVYFYVKSGKLSALRVGGRLGVSKDQVRLLALARA